ncbi:hypothetical protein ABPG72_016048 [Tetrahymena utriculariae]
MKIDKQNIRSQIKSILQSYEQLLSIQKQKLNGFFQKLFNKNKIVNETNLMIGENCSQNQIKNTLLRAQKELICNPQLIVNKLTEFQKRISINLDDLNKLSNYLQNDLQKRFENSIKDLEDQQIVLQILLINSSVSFEDNVKQILSDDYQKRIKDNITIALEKINNKLDELINDINSKLNIYKQKVQYYVKLKLEYLQKKETNQESQIHLEQPKQIQNQIQYQSNVSLIDKEGIQINNESYIELKKLQMNIINQNYFKQQQNNKQSMRNGMQPIRSSKSCIDIEPNNHVTQRRKTVAWNDNSFNQTQIIIWIDEDIQNDYNSKKILELMKKFGWVEVKGFQNFKQFEYYIDNKLYQQYERNIKVNQVLKQKISKTEQYCKQLEECNDQEDLTKSVISQKVVYQNLEEQTLKELSLEFIFIASGKVIKEKDDLPDYMESIIVYCNQTSRYKELFKNKSNISIITKDFEQIIQKIQETMFKNKNDRIYNWDIKKLKEFKEFDLIKYMSKSYCAQEIEKKSEEEILYILQNIDKCLVNKIKNINYFAKKISESFTDVKKALELYTANNFCGFIQQLMSYLNEQILQSASYLITTIRYAIQSYDDNCKEIFNNKNFKLYRGIGTNVKKFKQDLPEGTTFVTFNFSSSSSKEAIAKQFAEKGRGDPLIFEITFEHQDQDFEKCRPKKLSSSKFEEEEFLFNCFSIFLVKGYKQVNEFTYAQLSFQNNVFDD